MARRLHIQVVDNISRFARLEQDWDALLRASATGHSYFMQWRWQALWFEHLAPRGSRLHVLLIRDHREELIGIAPLYLRPRKILGMVLSNSLCLLGTGARMHTSEQVGLLVSAGRESEVADILARHLARRTHWHRVWLWNVPDGLPWVSALRKRLDCRIAVCDRSFYVRTDVPWNQVQSTWTRKFRENVERSTRILKDRQECRFSQVTSQHELQRLWPEFVRLHQLRWNRKGEPGSFSNPAFRTFLHDAMQQALAAGQLRFWYCHSGDRVVATLVAFVSNGTAYYFQGGFDPGFSKLSVGTAMVAHAIRECVSDPDIREFDFMGGDAVYKSSWTTQTRSALQVEYFRANWIARTFSLARALRPRLGRAKRAFLRMVKRASSTAPVGTYLQ